jgi:hypothetical protein
LVPTGFLIATAVSGLLMMHGLEAAVSVAAPHGAPSHQGDGMDPESHGVLGLCLFVVSIAGSGAAAVSTRRRPDRLSPARLDMMAWFGTPTRSSPAGRLLLIDLSVLRL